MTLAYPTPHIKAAPDDFAETVIMPGDPQRAKMIAEKYLDNPVLINDVRGALAYTGEYKGTKITVMASGMGMPSMGIYSYELFNIFEVKNIIRTGSAGGMQSNISVRDIVIAMSASTDSAYASQYNLPGSYSPTADYRLLKHAAESAEKFGVRYHVGQILTSDRFYSDDPTALKKWAQMGILCTEMETAALYMNAAKAGKNALSILTVSDHIFTGEATTSDERRDTFTQMIEIALDTALLLN